MLNVTAPQAYVVIQKYNEKYSVLILITQDAPGISDWHLILWTIANVFLYESEFIDPCHYTLIPWTKTYCD